MEKKVICRSTRMKKEMLDDDYTIYDNGEILHEYDKNAYPGGHSFSKTLSKDDISNDVKRRLLNDTPDENKDLVRRILDIDE